MHGAWKGVTWTGGIFDAKQEEQLPQAGVKEQQGALWTGRLLRVAAAPALAGGTWMAGLAGDAAAAGGAGRQRTAPQLRCLPAPLTAAKPLSA